MEFIIYTFMEMLHVHMHLGRLFKMITDMEVHMAMEDARLPYNGLFKLLQIFKMIMLFTVIIVLPALVVPRCGAL